jgi:tetratricopeptide (TPR) repeat protein
MERFLVPRGYGFIVKTARVYAEHGAAERAGVMRAVALSNDSGDVWGLAYDFEKYFDEIKWDDPMRRTVYTNLIERLVGGGNLNAAEKIHSEVTAWATELDDREFTAWLLFSGSRLDMRRQDLYRARDRANDALSMYEAMDNKVRVAEVHNHVAMIELQDGNPKEALACAQNALENGKVQGPEGKEGFIPGVVAQVENIRGIVMRRSGKPKEAAEHFKRSNEIAGQAGIAGLALDSGLALGEALLASGQVEQARDVLERVLQIARQLRNAARERNACELLAQAEGALRHYDKALALAERTLELSQSLRFEQALPIDFYNVGFFQFLNNKPAEALSFFRQSETRIAALGKHPVVKELHYYTGMASLKTGDVGSARNAFTKALEPLQEAKDWRKMCATHDGLAAVEQHSGNVEGAKRHLNAAIEFAKQANLKDERRALRKKLDALS